MSDRVDKIKTLTRPVAFRYNCLILGQFIEDNFWVEAP